MTISFSTFAKRSLRCSAAVLIALTLVACSDGSFNQPLEPVDAGSPERQPWRVLFAPGASTVVLGAAQCSVDGGAADQSGTVTLTLGTSTLQVSAVVGTTTSNIAYGPMEIGNVGQQFYYSMSVGTGTRTLARVFAGVPDSGFSYINAFFTEVSLDGLMQNLEFTLSPTALGGAAGARQRVACASVTNPINRTGFNHFVLSERLASFLAGTPTGVVSSALTLPGGCRIDGGRTSTYAISPAGAVQIDTTTLPFNWPDTLTDPRADYSEYLQYNNRYGSESSVTIITDSVYRGVSLRRIYGTSATFSHYCTAG